MNKCKQCGKEISDKATYCSDACRMAYKRSQPEHEHESEPEQKDPEQVPEQGEQGEQTQPEQKQPEHNGSDKVMGPNGYYYGQVLTKRMINGESWPDRTVGFCRKCGKEIDMETHPNNWDLWEVCLKCT